MTVRWIFWLANLCEQFSMRLYAYGASVAVDPDTIPAPPPRPVIPPPSWPEPKVPVIYLQHGNLTHYHPDQYTRHRGQA